MPTGPESARVVLITHPVDGARDFARRLVSSGAAACANLVPVTSIYRWRGEVAEDDEILLVVKTGAGRLEELQELVLSEHPYDVPEFVALVPDHVEATYLDWIVRSTANASDS